MNLGQILAELERRRLSGGLNKMPGAVNPRAFPAIMGIPPEPTLMDIINGAKVNNPNVRPPTPGPVLGGVRG